MTDDDRRIRELVDTAPELTEEQINQIRLLIHAGGEDVDPPSKTKRTKRSGLKHNNTSEREDNP